MSQTAVGTVETGSATVDTATAAAGGTVGRDRSQLCLLVAPVCVALVVGAVVVAATGSRTGVSGVEVVQAGLVVAWAVAGTSLGIHRRDDRLGPLVLGGAALGGIAVMASALTRHGALDAGAADLADGVVRLVVALLPAVALHFLLALPDGRLGERSRRVLVQLGYGAGFLTGAYLVAARPGLPRWPLVLEAALAVLATASPAHARYLRAGAVERRRMQWIGWAVAVAAEIVLVVVALHLLLDWPHHLGEISLASTALLPLALVAGCSPRLVARVDRLLTHPWPSPG
ncbi:MAG TPA: hypothetical protein VNT56_09020 [Acidimicrobiales bacterium]|nr:hypothetical protein [Acidimicrobiales bacterium]